MSNPPFPSTIATQNGGLITYLPGAIIGHAYSSTGPNSFTQFNKTDFGVDLVALGINFVNNPSPNPPSKTLSLTNEVLNWDNLAVGQLAVCGSRAVGAEIAQYITCDGQSIIMNDLSANAFTISSINGISAGAFGATGPTGPTGSTGPTGAAGANGSSSSYYNYRADNGATPSTGHISWSNFATQIASTYIRVSHIDQNGDDIDIFLNLVQQGNQLIIQDANLSDNYQTWLVSGTPIPNTGSGYVQYPITLVGSGGSPNFANNHPIILAVIASATPGPTGPTGPTGATGATGPTGAPPSLYIGQYYKSADQTLTSGNTDITFDLTQTWNNTGGYITHTDGTTDFTVAQAGIYQLEFNTVVLANGATYTLTAVGKSVNIDITRSPSGEQTVVSINALQPTAQNYAMSVVGTVYLEVGDVINLRIGNQFTGGPPTARGVQSTFDLNTFFTWRYLG